jgi:outer membrane protein OmpA-like peptidoglycan-associated protein
MRPESQFQLNELLNMLEEDSGYRIKLHGHTNGSASGDYVRLAENDTLFFKMSRIHERTRGSAKDLSYDRAMTVKLYLVSKGIAENRIEVIGWGGKKMIYDQHSKAAKRNIRVEVEVLDVTE